MERCEVVGSLPIVCAKTGRDIGHGEEVWLDPEQTNIDALVSAGHVVRAPVKAAKD